MSIAEDLAILEQQEHLLRFTSFNPETAWELGCILRTLLMDCRAGGTIEIELANHLLFACATPTSNPGQADWIRRKRNVVHRFGRSSYAIGRILESNNETLQSRHCLEGLRLRRARRRLSHPDRRHRPGRQRRDVRPAAARRSQPRHLRARQDAREGRPAPELTLMHLMPLILSCNNQHQAEFVAEATRHSCSPFRSCWRPLSIRIGTGHTIPRGFRLRPERPRLRQSSPPSPPPHPTLPGWGFGFEGDAPAVEASSIGGTPFFFSFDAPEGNYRITVTLGADEASDTTVKAELRRLMIETAAAPAGGSITKTFIVNVRTPALPSRRRGPSQSPARKRAGGARLGQPHHARVRRHASQRAQPHRRSRRRADDLSPRRLHRLRSDGRTLRLLGPDAATSSSSRPSPSPTTPNPARPLPPATLAAASTKILSLIKPGDVFIVQFGHNDMKEKAKDPDAASKYKAGLIAWANAIKAKGATPVIVTPMNRHTFSGRPRRQQPRRVSADGARSRC